MSAEIPEISVDLPKPKQKKQTWPNLVGAGLSLAVSCAAQQHDGLVVVLVSDPILAEQLKQELPFFLDAKAVPLLNFPDWETLPYDKFSPHQDIISERLTVLYRLPQLKKGIVILPASTALSLLCPQSYLTKRMLLVQQKDRLNLSDFKNKLESSGYQHTHQVMEHGEFSVRGAIVDLFPMGYALPIRLELLDENIESIRLFDPHSQRSVKKVSKLELLPAKEFPTDKAGIEAFRKNWRHRFSGDPRQSQMYLAVSEGVFPAGIEYYFPLFFEKVQSFFDYLPQNSLLLEVGDLTNSIQAFLSDSQNRFEQFSADLDNPILPLNSLFLTEDIFFKSLKQFSRIQCKPSHTVEHIAPTVLNTQFLPDLKIDHKLNNPLEKVQKFLDQKQYKVLFCAQTPGRKEVIKTLFKKHEIELTELPSWLDFLVSEQQTCFTLSPIEAGLLLPGLQIALISENALFEKRVSQYRARFQKPINSQTQIQNLVELNLDDLVVHIQHGIGRYRGLKKLPGQETEFMLLEYDKGDKLYVPITALEFVHRYTGLNSESVSLHTLGSKQWEKSKSKASQKIHDTAAELLEIYAQRHAKKQTVFHYPEKAFLEFSASFPFEETPDQQKAIDAVVIDLVSPKPMDRVICGDVGFGKTEVAMRAAFLALHNEKQTALLVPTTLLAQQHYQTFLDRFSDHPVEIEVLSRFKTAKEQVEILKKVKTGKIDILIGTHKLLSQGVAFQDLGLLIIDEEHRFGVRQKEVIKKIRADLNVLTLTATPIPRTLNMAMSGIRDLSIIATAPQKRLSVKTFVREYDIRLIQEAMVREHRRGGQVYFLHNQVDTIYAKAESIQKLLPEAKIGVAHGQMPERDLERVMLDFYHRRYHILICTTIIETGIDVPSANTIIIDRADKFGLAQLHQLRGRVGRSHHQAYAFLLVPQQEVITQDAKKRLQAISSLTTLGIGFTLATQDLEIRGTGELLGENQSGQMHELGFTLYMKLLDQAIEDLKSQTPARKKIELAPNVEIDLQVCAFIPEDYLPNVRMRLILYKRIASVEHIHELDDLLLEMADRFGIMPTPCKQLFRLTQLKLICKQLGLFSVKLTQKGGHAKFIEKPNIDLEKFIQLIQTQSHCYELMGARGVRLKGNFETDVQKFEFIEQFLEKIQKKEKPS